MSDARRVLIALTLICAPVAARAQDASQLKNIEKDLARSEAERTAAAAEAERIARDLTKARETEIGLAKDIQDQEHSLNLLESRIGDLERQAGGRSAALVRRDAQMRQTLMALERLALRPADALTLSPLAPDDAVRAAILLRAAVPAITTSANALQAELAEVYRLRTQIQEQRAKVAAGAAMLLDKRTKLAAAIADKSVRQTQVSARNQELEARVGRLAREAEDLRALFAKLAEEKARREAEERKAAAAAIPAPSQEKTPAEKAKDQARIVLKAPPGVAPESGPARLFSKARGTLPYPAIGRITAKFGENPPGAAAGSVMSKGLTIATRSTATVVSPFDGVVAFAGPFRGYGELLIIEHTEGYHTLLAGLGRIDAAVGQKVLAGEPLGSMSHDASPALYVELRRDGQPINPLPWLASRRDDRPTDSTEPARPEKQAPG